MSNNPFGAQGWTPERMQSVAGKTYVITGANAGAGYEATKLLAKHGAEVIMACRNEVKAKAAIESIRSEVADAKLAFVELDLESLKATRSGAERILAAAEKIDALVCNAAIAQVAKQEITADGFESQLGVNHYGHFLLCGLLYDRVKESQGRIVVVGSTGYAMGIKRIPFEDMNWDAKYNPMNAYCASKLAQMMFAYELQRRVNASDDEVQVHVCHPGAARTELSKEEANLMTKIVFAIFSPLAQSAEKGSWPEALCLVEDDLQPERFYGPTQRANMVGIIGETPLEEHVLDQEAAAQLWTVSEQATGLAWSPDYNSDQGGI